MTPRSLLPKVSDAELCPPRLLYSALGYSKKRPKPGSPEWEKVEAAKQRLKDAALARGYGRLDALHGQDYAPRPEGMEAEYRKGYAEGIRERRDSEG